MVLETGAARRTAVIREVQQLLGDKSRAAAFAPLLYGRDASQTFVGLAPQWLADRAGSELAAGS